MATESQAREVEIDRALVEMRQRLQQMSGRDMDVVRTTLEIRQREAQLAATAERSIQRWIGALAAAILATAALATYATSAWFLTHPVVGR